MEGDASRPASRKGTPKLSSTSACKQTTSVGRASKISTSIGRCDRVEPDSTPRGSRNGVRSFDDRLLGADDEFLLPRVSESRVSVTESLVAALSKPVSDAVSEAVSEKVKAQLVDLTGRVVEAVCDIQVEVAKACMKDLYHELAARLTSDIVPVLADMSRQLSMPAISVTPAGIMATSMSSAPSMVSRTSTSRSSSYHRGGSGGTLVSNPDDVSTRDVKSLENTLADQLLEDLGLSFSSHGSRAETRRRELVRSRVLPNRMNAARRAHRPGGSFETVFRIIFVCDCLSTCILCNGQDVGPEGCHGQAEVACPSQALTSDTSPKIAPAEGGGGDDTTLENRSKVTPPRGPQTPRKYPNTTSFETTSSMSANRRLDHYSEATLSELGHFVICPC